jgi:hypothetical protein
MRRIRNARAFEFLEVVGEKMGRMNTLILPGSGKE